jgi:hypothetical protein
LDKKFLFSEKKIKEKKDQMNNHLLLLSFVPLVKIVGKIFLGAWQNAAVLPFQLRKKWGVALLFNGQRYK